MKSVRLLARRYPYFSLIILMMFFLTAAVLAADVGVKYKYVASKEGKKYHLPSCPHAKRIKAEQLVTFQTVEEAKQAGYTPCRICKPPEKD